MLQPDAYFAGFRVPLLERPRARLLNRDIGRDFELYVAQPRHVIEEAGKAQAATMLRHGWVRGGDYYSYETCPQVVTVAGAATTGSVAISAVNPPSPTYAGSGSNTNAVGSGGFWYAGRTIRVTLRGTVTTSTSPGTAVVSYTLNSSGGALLGATTAATLIASQTNATWKSTMDITCRSLGTAGSLWGQGEHFWSITIVAAGTVLLIPTITPVTAAIDTTANNTIVMDVTMGATTVSTSMQLGTWEVLN